MRQCQTLPPHNPAFTDLNLISHPNDNAYHFVCHIYFSIFFRAWGGVCLGVLCLWRRSSGCVEHQVVAYLVLQVFGCLVPVWAFHTCGFTMLEFQCLIIILVYITHLGVCGLAHDTFLEIWNVIYILCSHLHAQVTPLEATL